MKYYSEFVQYWRDMPARVPAITGISIGSDMELFDLQSNTDTYPHVRISTPKITFVGNDNNRRTRYAFTVYVMEPVIVDSEAEQDRVLANTELLMRELYAVLIADGEADVFDFIQGAQGDAIERYSADRLFGWYIDTAIEVYMATCTTPSVPPVSDEITTPTYTVAIPQGKLLVAIRVLGDTAQTVSVGTSANGDDIGVASGAAEQTLMFAGLQVEGSATVHLSGLAGTNRVRIWMI